MNGKSRPWYGSVLIVSYHFAHARNITYSPRHYTTAHSGLNHGIIILPNMVVRTSSSRIEELEFGLGQIRILVLILQHLIESNGSNHRGLSPVITNISVGCNEKGQVNNPLNINTA